MVFSTVTLSVGNGLFAASWDLSGFFDRKCSSQPPPMINKMKEPTSAKTLNRFRRLKLSRPAPLFFLGVTSGVMASAMGWVDTSFMGVQGYWLLVSGYWMLDKGVVPGRCSRWLLWRRRHDLFLFIESTEYLAYPGSSIRHPASWAIMAQRF